MTESSTFRPTADHLVIHQFDTLTPMTGGIPTFIRGLVKFAPPNHEFAFAGVDASEEGRPLGRWYRDRLEGRDVWFMPVARLHPTQFRRVPHGLRLVGGLARYRPHVDGAPIEVHRPDTAIGVSMVYPRTSMTLYVHGDWAGGADPKQSDSTWRRYPGGYARLEQLALRRADRVFLIGEARSVHLRQPKVRSIATWFDPEFFYAAERGEHDSLDLVWVGRLERGKDPILAMRSFAEVVRREPRATLTVVGDGSMDAQARAECVRLGIADQVDFPGFMSATALSELLRASDVFLFTAETGEGFSIALNEALACGLAAAVTEAADPNGVVVNDLNGARAGARTAESVADAVFRARACSPRACSESVAHLAGPIAVPRLLAMQPSRATT